MKTEDIGTQFSKIEQTPFYKKFGTPLYHASRDDINGVMKIKKRSRPRDTSIIFHNEVNALSKQKHGIEVRNILFVAKTPVNAYSYAPSGTVYYVSPITDNYQLWYSTNTEDMTNDIRVTSSAMAMSLKSKLRFETIEAIKDDEDFDNQSDTIVIKRVENLVIDYFKEAVRKDTYRISDCYKEVYQKLEENKMVKERFKTPMLKTILKEKTHYENLAYEYVLTLTQVTSESDMKNIGDSAELMLYDPEGVYVVKYAYN